MSVQPMKERIHGQYKNHWLHPTSERPTVR